MVQMQGARRGDSEAYDCTPQEDTRSATPQMGHFQRPLRFTLQCLSRLHDAHDRPVL
jgi:hypothetical protein